MTDENGAASYFISFASKDIAVAAELADRLDALNLRTFFAPRDIGAGENFALRIVQAIVESTTVVVLLSDASATSPHVRREVSLAIDERRRLIPVTLPGTNFPRDFTAEWSYWLSAVQVLSFSSMNALVELLAARPTVRGVEAAAPVARPTTTAVPVTASEPISPVSLLRPEHAIVPLTGRDNDLARLTAWLDRGTMIGVRVITAPGGNGKSRLAREFMRVATERGWDAVFLRDLRSIDTTGQEPRLLVVDYAETKAQELADMLRRLLSAPSGTPVRVLLLARGSGDWWRTLASSDPDIEDLLAEATVQVLAPITQETANDVYRKAVESFARALDVDVPNVEAPGEQGDSIVDLLQRALLAVLAGSHGDSTGSAAVVRRLLAHERRYVRNASVGAGLRDFDDTDFDRVVALFSLFPPVDESQAAQLVGIALAGADAQRELRVARLLRRVYPAVGRYSSGLKPDVVAELAVAGLLDEDGSVPGGLATWDAMDDARYESGLRLLSRAATTSDAAAGELGRVIGASGVGRLASAVSVAIQVETPQAIAAAIGQATTEGRFDDDLRSAFEALPEETVALSDVAARIAERLLARVDSPGATLLLDASNRFSDAGWGDQALTAVAGGISELRADPAPAARLELGRALSNLSNRMWEVGRLEEAVAPAVEAVDVLADADDLTLVGARNNLAFRLIEAARYRDARAQLERAETAIQAQAMRSGPGRPRALSVSNNTVCLDSALGEWARAAELAGTLIEERRGDYAAQRDRNLAYLARALTNAAIPFARTGDIPRAEVAIAEARALHRLTAARAPIFAFEAAESAFIDAIVRLLGGRFDGVAEPLEDARRTLASIRDDLPGLADRLGQALEEISSLGDDEQLGNEDLHAIGSPGPGHVGFPLLLEYKDL